MMDIAFERQTTKRKRVVSPSSQSKTPHVLGTLLAQDRPFEHPLPDDIEDDENEES